jgi:hypothetical protein
VLLPSPRGRGGGGTLACPRPTPLQSCQCPFFAAPFFRHSSRVGVGVAPGRAKRKCRRTSLCFRLPVCSRSSKGCAVFRGAFFPFIFHWLLLSVVLYMCKAAHPRFRVRCGCACQRNQKRTSLRAFRLFSHISSAECGACVWHGVCGTGSMHQCTNAPIECTNAPIKCTNAPMQLCTNAAMHTGTYAHMHECTRNAHAHQGAYAPAARRTPRRHGVPAAAPHAMPVPRPHTAPRRCPSRCAACASVGRQAGLRRAPLSVEARSGPGRSTASPRSG